MTVKLNQKHLVHFWHSSLSNELALQIIHGSKLMTQEFIMLAVL